MESVSTISTDLTEARLLVEGIKGPQDQMGIVQADSAIQAIHQKIRRGEGLEHFESFLAIQQLFESKVKPQSGLYQAHFSSSSPSSLMDRSVDRAAATVPSPHSIILGGREARPKLVGTTTLGTINQYDDGRHPPGTFSVQYRVACPSTTLAFASRFLNHGTTGLDGAKIDQLIRRGQDEFLPLVARRRQVVDEIVEARIPRDPDKGTKLKGFFEGKLVPAARTDKEKKALGKLKVYGVAYEFDVEIKGSQIKLALRYGREVLNTWEGADLTEISETFADQMLREARILTKNSDPILAGNTMAPSQAERPYAAFLGNVLKAPDAFTLTPGQTPRGEAHQRQILDMLRGEILPHAAKAHHGRAAAAITINGQILGIGIEVKQDDVTITLFDSHGKTRLHGRHEGYTYSTKSIEDAAAKLIQMMNVVDTSTGHQPGKNEVGLWLATPHEVPVPFLDSPASAPARVASHVERQDEERKEAPRSGNGSGDGTD